VALAAQLVRFLERDQLTSGQVQHVPVPGIVTVQAPPVVLIVLEDYIVVKIHQLALFEIGFHLGMAHSAGIGIFAERRRGHLNIGCLFDLRLRGYVLRILRMSPADKKRTDCSKPKDGNDKSLSEKDSFHFDTCHNLYKISRYTRFFIFINSNMLCQPEMNDIGTPLSLIVRTPGHHL
jgi:hypothetical protein